MRIQPAQVLRTPSRSIATRLAAFAFCAACSLQAARAVRADESDMRPMLLQGFGTLGAVHSSEDRADFVTNILRPNGAGFSHNWSTDVDSEIGGQLTANLTSRLSAVVQIIASQDYANTYRPHVEWADIKYQFTADFDLRAGRIVLPSFLLSDTRNVGYTNPWVRPPTEVYGLNPITNSDGLDTSYRMHIGDIVQTFVASFGHFKQHLPVGGSVDAENLWIVADTIEYGAATAHLAYLHADLAADYLGPLFDGFNQFGPQGRALSDRYDPRNTPVSFFGFGAMYDPGRWFAMAEWATANFHSVFGEDTAWYVSGGYRVGKFTPYMTYAVVDVNSPTFDPGLTVTGLPPGLAQVATALNAGLNAGLGAGAKQRTIALGARWDFMHNLDFKLQFDHSRLGAGSPGRQTNEQLGYRPGGTVNLVTVTIDFVL